jgi:hypothetical protein
MLARRAARSRMLRCLLRRNAPAPSTASRSPGAPRAGLPPDAWTRIPHRKRLRDARLPSRRGAHVRAAPGRTRTGNPDTRGHRRRRCARPRPMRSSAESRRPARLLARENSRRRRSRAGRGYDVRLLPRATRSTYLPRDSPGGGQGFRHRPGIPGAAMLCTKMRRPRFFERGLGLHRSPSFVICIRAR